MKLYKNCPEYHFSKLADSRMRKEKFVCVYSSVVKLNKKHTELVNTIRLITKHLSVNLVEMYSFSCRSTPKYL